MKYSEIDSNASRVTINAHQCYQGLRQVKEDLSHYRGGMYWKTVTGTDYLIRDFGTRQNSLGKRSEHSEAVYKAFTAKKSELTDRLASLSKVQTSHARACVAAYAGRVPLMVAQIVRKLEDTPVLASKSLIVGTNALYAYEAAASVRFEEDIIATQDVDILLDTRKRIRVASSEIRGVIGLLQSVDKSFEVMRGTTFRAINKNGFMVDLIQPQKDMRFSSETAVSDFPEDLSVVEIKGLDWLVSCPKFQATVIDEKGYPASMVVPDPRAFAMHKLWLSAQPDREPAKKGRDLGQARAVFQLVTDRLCFLEFGSRALQAMPFEVRARAGTDFGFGAK
jgi:hypothetical protein